MTIRTRFLTIALAVVLLLAGAGPALAQPSDYQSGGDGGRQGGLQPTVDDLQTVVPAIEALWLADADADVLIDEISSGEVFDRNTLPANLTVVAVANDDTESVEFGFGGVMSFQTENVVPYALAGDASGDLAPADLPDGWHTVRARPYAADGATGSHGDEVLLTFAIFEEDIVVDSTLDGHDDDPGDGLCLSTPGGGIDGFATRSATRDRGSDGGSFMLAAETGGGMESAESFTGTSPPTRALQLAGHCTLRAAIEEANARVGQQHISVPNLGTYVLTLGELGITDTVVIEGAGRPIVDAEGGSRVFNVGGASGVTIDNFDLRNGVAQHVTDRGGVMVVEDSTVEIHDSVLRGGQANFGGGIYSETSDLTVRRSVVRDNTAGNPDSFGNGGLTQRGGGISTVQGTINVESSSVIGNRAVRGGGLSIAGTQAFISNTSILENEAVQKGGGFELIGSDGNEPDVHMAWSTVAWNEAGSAVGDGDAYRTGGGFFLGTGSLISANSIIAENSTALDPTNEYYGPDCHNSTPGAFISYRGNLVGVLTDTCVMYDSHLDEQLPWDTVGSAAAPADPGFTTISQAVRPVMQLDVNSPAVDHGTGAPGVEFYGYCPDADGRDNPRPADDGLCDIGATERQ